jgi:hypothetical protein
MFSYFKCYKKSLIINILRDIVKGYYTTILKRISN